MHIASAGIERARHLLQQENYGAAVDILEQLVHCEPAQAHTHELLGMGYAGLGRIAESLEQLRAAMACDPQASRVQIALGAALVRAGQARDAAQCLRDALGRFGATPVLLYNLGLAEQAAGETAAAAASYRWCISLEPQFAEAHNNLGSVLEIEGRAEEALASYREALRIRPGYARALTNLGNLLRKMRRLPESIRVLGAALAAAPNHVPALCNLGQACHAQGEMKQARECFRRALELRPGLTEALLGLMQVEFDTGQYEAALSCCERLIELNPNSAEAHNGAGMALGRLERHDEALASYDRALACQPDYSSARWNKALLCLTLGRFREGWPLFESRFQVSGLQAARQRDAEPRWSGTPALAGRSLLVYAEYGLGDTIQFSRFVKRLSTSGAHVTFEVQPMLRRLMRSLDPAVQVLAIGEFAGQADYHCPLMSLPMALGVELNDIPERVPYLRAEQDRISRWANRLLGADQLPGTGKLRVGIAWRGNPLAETSALRGRSIDLRCFRQLLQVPGIELVCLQKDVTGEELSAAQLGPAFTHPGDDLDAGPDAFCDTAAIMAGLDLVITSDTAIAHLAGALAVPVWVALHTTADWRWLTGRTDSPWYPGMRLFRQSSPGDWQVPFECMTRELFSHRNGTGRSGI
ncbi:MAG TPA: tetratricopeptide repeat protein [Steroidobacteraceae bacterium]|nr:tetratricopeptide repeat protein [Steroidobacteraceae bacterium]